FSQRAALIVAALFAVNPYFVWYSQEARAYALLVLLCTLSLLFFLRAERDGRDTWKWAVTSALALCTHYFAALLLVPEAAWLLWRLDRCSARGSPWPGSRWPSRCPQTRGSSATTGAARSGRWARPRRRACWWSRPRWGGRPSASTRRAARRSRARVCGSRR